MELSPLPNLLEEAKSRPMALGVDDLARLLALEDSSREERALFDAAYAVKCRYVGRNVSVRGLVEAGNICAKDCLYCGIRKSNRQIARYSLGADEIFRLAQKAKAFGYASLVIQSGEIESEEHTAFIENVLQRIQALDMGVTLSLGEQSEDVFRRWREAGAERYLLRIETSDSRLYSTLHPLSHSWSRRYECLRVLHRLGYQLGTGVMTGLPGQDATSLARDIVFFGEIDAHMIGMGPYIPHPAAPLSLATPFDKSRALHLGLRMIAATRLYLHNVNIAAATALQALAHDGREKGILAGANVIMPNITDVAYRASYQLYAGKPCLDEDASLCRQCLDRRLEAIGEKILYNKRGDSPKFTLAQKMHDNP